MSVKANHEKNPIICLLYRGVSSIVRRCIEKETGHEYAAKIIDVSSDPDDSQGFTLLQASHREVAILHLAAGHRYISMYNNFDFS